MASANALTKDEYDTRKMGLEIERLEFDNSFLGRWSRVISTLIAIVTGAVAVLTGIYQYSKSVEETTLAREQRDRVHRAELFAKLISDNPREIAIGVAGFLDLFSSGSVENKVLEKNRQFGGIRLHLMALSDKRELSIEPYLPRFEKIGTQRIPSYEPYPAFETPQAYRTNLLIPLIEVFSPAERQALYLAIFENTDLLSDRLFALNKLNQTSDLWKSALSSREEYVRFVALRQLAYSKEPSARDFLESFLGNDDHQFVEAAIHGLGIRKERESVLKLLSLIDQRGWQIRFRLFGALGAIGDKRALEQLMSFNSGGTRYGQLNTFEQKAFVDAVQAISANAPK